MQPPTPPSASPVRIAVVALQSHPLAASLPSSIDGCRTTALPEAAGSVFWHLVEDAGRFGELKFAPPAMRPDYVVILMHAAKDQRVLLTDQDGAYSEAVRFAEKHCDRVILCASPKAQLAERSNGLYLAQPTLGLYAKMRRFHLIDGTDRAEFEALLQQHCTPVVRAAASRWLKYLLLALLVAILLFTLVRPPPEPRRPEEQQTCSERLLRLIVGKFPNNQALHAALTSALQQVPAATNCAAWLRGELDVHSAALHGATPKSDWLRHITPAVITELWTFVTLAELRK